MTNADANAGRAILPEGNSGVTGLDQIQFFTIPVVDDPRNPTARAVWTPAAADVWQRIARDQPIPGRLTSGVIKASAPTGGSDGTSADRSPTSSPGAPTAALDDGQDDGADDSADDAARAEQRRLNGLCA
ncbi:MAG: hypothetical protein ACRCYU_13355 [Nocardioides sp.]